MSLEQFKKDEELLIRFLRGLNSMYKNTYWGRCRAAWDITSDYTSEYLKWIAQRGSEENYGHVVKCKYFEQKQVPEIMSKGSSLQKNGPYAYMNPAWNMIYEEDLIGMLKMVTKEYRKKIIKATLKIINGNFQDAVLYQLGPLHFMAVFYIPLEGKGFLPFFILPKRQLVKDDSDELFVRWGFEYSQYIRFNCIVDSVKEIKRQVKSFTTRNCYDTDRYQIFLYTDNFHNLPFFDQSITKEGGPTSLKEVLDGEYDPNLAEWKEGNVCRPRFAGVNVKARSIDHLRYDKRVSAWVNLGDVYEDPENAKYYYNHKAVMPIVKS